MRLQRKAAIVTGAGSGIGKAIAIAYAREGAAIVVNDQCLEIAQETVDCIRSDQGKAICICADVSNLGEHEGLINAAVREYGSLDILVNNAGVEIHEPVLESRPETWDKVVGTNLKGPYFLSCKAAAAMSISGGGKIICVSSVHDVEPLWDRAIYSISKSGIPMLVKSLGLELATRRIIVNAISPGAILTNMNRAGLSDQKERSKLLAKIPMRRIGDPEDIVGAAVFLASSESDYVTGTTIYVDGGFLLL